MRKLYCVVNLPCSSLTKQLWGEIHLRNFKLLSKSFEREAKIKAFFASRFCPHVLFSLLVWGLWCDKDTVKGKSLWNLLALSASSLPCCAYRITLPSLSLCRLYLEKSYNSICSYFPFHTLCTHVRISQLIFQLWMMMLLSVWCKTGIGINKFCFTNPVLIAWTNWIDKSCWKGQ